MISTKNIVFFRRIDMQACGNPFYALAGRTPAVRKAGALRLTDESACSSPAKTFLETVSYFVQYNDPSFSVYMVPRTTLSLTLITNSSISL